MNRRYGVIVAATVSAAFVLGLAAKDWRRPQPVQAAQAAKCVGCSVNGKTTPRMPDGHPNLNGYWGDPGTGNHIGIRGDDGTVLFDFGGNGIRPDGRTNSSTPGAPNDFGSDAYKNQTAPVYKPEYAAKVKAIVDHEYGGTSAQDPMFKCRPFGVPRAGSNSAGGALQIVQTPEITAVLYEDAPGPQYRLIYTDGRQHPDDLDPSFLGDSIGHWEGDALVVDVTGFNDETWLGGGLGGPRYALIHSDQEHVTERWTRNGNDLTYEATVEDPVMFAKPWAITPRHIQHADASARLLDYPCVPNDEGHLIEPTKEDPFVCNYCTQARRTPGTGLSTIRSKDAGGR